MLTLLAAVVLSQKPTVSTLETNFQVDLDAGVAPVVSLIHDDAISIYARCPEIDPDAGVPLAFAAETHLGILIAVAPDGGNDWYLPYPRAQRASCKIDACAERDEELEAWKKPVPAWVVASAVISGIITGALAVYQTCTHFPVLCGSR